MFTRSLGYDVDMQVVRRPGLIVLTDVTALAGSISGMLADSGMVETESIVATVIDFMPHKGTEQ